MFNNDNKGIFETVRQQLEKLKKAKRLWAILGGLLPLFQVILIVIIVVAVTLLPVMFFNNIKDGFYNGVDKFLNFLSTGRWMSSENAYYLTLEREYLKFQSYNNKEGEFDIPLLAATSHYVNMFGPHDFDYANDEDINHLIEDEDYNKDKIEYAIKEKTSRTFYEVAEHELGTSTTIIPTQKKLIGHLVDLKLETRCVNVKDLILNTDKDEEESARDILKAAWADFMELTWQTSGNSVKYVINSLNVFEFVNLIHAYKDQGHNYLEVELARLLHSTKEDNMIKEFVRIIEQSDLSPCEGILNIPIPTIIRFINYDNYKEYLKEFYLKKFYINCKNCPYKDKTDEYKDIIADRMIEEIFQQKDTWDYLNNAQILFRNISSIYIPGLSSMPIPISEDGTLNVTSVFGMRIHPIYKTPKMHNGIDLGYPMGTPVSAIADGEVVHAGCQSNGCSKGWGKYVKIKHDIDGDGVTDYYTLYAHLSVLNTTKGSIVGGGQQIGEVGSTGASTGAHLHLEIHDKNGTPIDPLPILKGIMEGNSVFDNTPITTYYNQGDYKNVAYCKGMASGGKEATISSSGCLPTSYAMVAVKLGYKMTPVGVANYICQNTSYRIEGFGTSSAFFTDQKVMNNFKIKATRVKNRTIDNVVSLLKSGKPIIVSVKNGHFNPSGAGHFIVIDSIDPHGNIKILDPGNRSKTTRSYTKEEINTYVINHINSGMWYFEKG